MWSWTTRRRWSCRSRARGCSVHTSRQSTSPRSTRLSWSSTPTSTIWAKLCLELSPQGEVMVVSVVTRGASDDCNSVIVDGPVWLRVAHLERAFAFHYSLDGATWHMVRYFSLGEPEPVEVGFLAQSPTGSGLYGDLQPHRLRPGTAVGRPLRGLTTEYSQDPTGPACRGPGASPPAGCRAPASSSAGPVRRQRRWRSTSRGNLGRRG